MVFNGKEVKGLLIFEFMAIFIFSGFDEMALNVIFNYFVHFQYIFVCENNRSIPTVLTI